MEDLTNRDRMIWTKNEIRSNRDFIKALDEEGRYFKLVTEKDKEFYLDDFVSDDEFNALINQLKVYLEENIEHWEKYLKELEYEERNNLQRRDEGHS